MGGKGIALIVGAGPGLGGSLAHACARAGMDVAVAARDPARMQALADAIAGHGVAARGFACDVTVEAEVETLFQRVKTELGEPSLVVYNPRILVRASILETDAGEFERCWRVLCFGALLVGRAAARLMVARAGSGGVGGTIIFTGATASLRGGPQFASFASAKFAQRALAQSMARELGPKGVHVAHVVIDGIIGKDADGDSTLDPDAIADAYLDLHRQDRSAWTHELDLRPWSENF